ncbi:MAG TPA: zinc-binding dehydrogenase [Pyrinomonadaceae bacterium]|jgi:threonine dehydrogenase-like Zn-dependent dehydrogenase|nr:zinc-binding dehydrogenase [Pyrinomonadaceae bacterium]
MTKMLGGQITGERLLEMIEIPRPDIEKGEILVQLEVGSICGSDLPYFLFDTSHPALTGASAPLPPTLSLHELTGFVAQSRNERFKEGDRVLALPTIPHRGLAEYFVSSDDRAVPLPAGRANHLVLSQPLGTVIHACLKLPEVLGQTAVVLGQGPVGQLFTALLRHMGVVRLIAVDLLPERLKVSTRMGATHTVCGSAAEVAATIETITEGKLADLAVEAIGKAETLNLAAKLVRRNGTLLAFGLPHRYNYDFAFHEFFWNEGRLICSLGPTVDDFRAAVDMISNGVIDVAPLVTHTFPFRSAQEAFTVFADRTDGVIKVVLTAED